MSCVFVDRLNFSFGSDKNYVLRINSWLLFDVVGIVDNFSTLSESKRQNAAFRFEFSPACVRSVTVLVFVFVELITFL